MIPKVFSTLAACLVLMTAAAAQTGDVAQTVAEPAKAPEGTARVTGTNATILTPVEPEVAERSEQRDLNVAPALQKLEAGLVKLQDEDYTGAIPLLEEALRGDPALRVGWEGLGWSYWKSGREDDAIRLWETMMKIRPSDPMPYQLLAQTALFRKDFEKADELFRQSLERDPSQYAVRVWYAQNMLRFGRAAQAEKELRGLLERDPERLDVEVDLARSLVMQQKYDEALIHWQHVCEQLPENQLFQMELAQVENVAR
jgi:tetratricopeptide (TPR) repeat protein